MVHWEKQWCGDQDTNPLACLFLVLEFLDEILLYFSFLYCLFKETGRKLLEYVKFKIHS